MSNQSTINRLLDLTNKKLESAGTALAAQIRSHAAIKSDHQRLIEYREDYLKRLGEQSQSGVSATSYDNARRFIDSLNQAIAHQERLMNEANTRVDTARVAWQGVRREKLSYQTLEERRAEESRAAQAQVERKQTDEDGARLAARQRPVF